VRRSIAVRDRASIIEASAAPCDGRLFAIRRYPLFAWLAAEPSVSKLILVQALLSITLSGYYGPFGALIAALFPANVRSIGLSLAYNVAVMVFGGFGPLLVTWLIESTGSPLAPTYYVMSGLTLSIVAVACIPGKRHADLDARRKPA
jgi:hypothetical protein